MATKRLPLPDVVKALVCLGNHEAPADGFKVLVNPDTGQAFSLASKDYRLIRHEEAAWLEDVIRKSPGLGRYEVDRWFRGQVCSWLLRMRSVHCCIRFASFGSSAICRFIRSMRLLTGLYFRMSTGSPSRVDSIMA